MEQIEDAPWIREAERDGMVTGPDVECPVCGSGRCRTIYMNKFYEVFACDQCLEEQDADDWFNDQIENERMDH